MIFRTNRDASFCFDATTVRTSSANFLPQYSKIGVRFLQCEIDASWYVFLVVVLHKFLVRLTPGLYVIDSSQVIF